MYISLEGTFIMKAMLSFFVVLLISISSVVQAKVQAGEEMDYCYKPSKPLFFATSEYKNRYAEDMKEYQRCRKGFLEMQARVTAMEEESEKNAKKMRESFVNRHY